MWQPALLRPWEPKISQVTNSVFLTSDNENWLKVCEFCIVLIFCIKFPVNVIENLDISFRFLLCVMCACWWCKLCSHSTSHPSTSSPDRPQTCGGGWPEHQSRIPCDFLLPPHLVLEVLFHPEYLLTKKAEVCHVDKTWKWKILVWPPGMMPDSSWTHLLSAISSHVAGLSGILSLRQAWDVAILLISACYLILSVLYGCKSWFFSLREQYWFESIVLWQERSKCSGTWSVITDFFFFFTLLFFTVDAGLLARS